MISEKLLRRRPQELGKIKIGGKGELRKSQGGKEFRLPVKYNHFEVTTRHRGGNDNFARDEVIHARIGDKPTELHGMLMFPTVEENFFSEMTQYDGRTKIRTCDGETFTDLRTGSEAECPRVQDRECSCKPYMRLVLQLWDAPVLGYHFFRSTGWETTANIQSALQDIYEQFGTLYHVPVKLVLYPATVNYKERGQERTSDAFMVGLVLAFSLEEVAERVLKSSRLISSTRQELKQLSAGVQQDLAQRDVEEAADIAEEYFPDQDPGLRASVATQATLQQFKTELRGDEPPTLDADFEIEESPAAEKEGSGQAHPPAGEQAPAAAGTPEPDPPSALCQACGRNPHHPNCPERDNPQDAVGAMAATAKAGAERRAERRKQKSREQLNKEYFAKIGELTDWSDGERKLWQEQRIGKASCSTWEAADYERALQLLDAGELSYDSPQISLPVDPDAMPV